MMETITQLCIKEPKEGKIKGKCVVCGNSTETGHPYPFSDNFSGYSYLFNGDCTCPYCYEFFKAKNLRMKSWIVDMEGIKFVKRLEFREYILNPLSPPFGMYLTKGGKKQGWLSGLKYVNRSREKFYVMTDFVDTVFIEKKEAIKMDGIITRLREKKVGKTQLLSGEFNPINYRKAMQEGWLYLLEEARKNIRKPLWEIMIYISE
ncbi:MAG: hypothetical protein ACOYWZ_04475 [Bacillota bacterium]